MVIATYHDGRDLTYDDATVCFTIGGTPVTVAQVVEYDRYAQILWPSDEMRDWFYQIHRRLAYESRLEAKAEAKAAARERSAERAQARLEALTEWSEKSQHGSLNPAMICPHCQARGTIRTKSIDQKKGISGGKATAAVLTAGASLWVTGLSRKQAATQAFCTNCSNTWYF